jgi:hypothetical protein
MGRIPYKKESEKLIESITLSLNQLHMATLENYAKKINVSLSSAMIKILTPSGCFNHKISDELFEELNISLKKYRIANGKWIPESEIKTIRSRITKEQKKSLFYEAIHLQKTSPAFFIRNVVETFLDSKNNFEKAPKSGDDLLKKLWKSASIKIKKELIKEFLKNQTESIK